MIQLAAWLLVSLAVAWFLRRKPILAVSLAILALVLGTGDRRLPVDRSGIRHLWRRIRLPGC